MRYFILLFSLLTLSLSAEIIDREGAGYLEIKNGQKVLHVKGKPYERGFQHGKLLKADIQRNIAEYIDAKRPESAGRVSSFLEALPQLCKHIPSSLYDELQGLSDGAEVPLKKALLLNLFPEMFHCSAISAKGTATRDGKLYHVRVLDYSIGKNLQSTAVLMIAEPSDAYAFLNVTYAGFIGTVTGMNEKKIAVGEIGGQGYGKWDGMPMAFLLRTVLENCATLEEAKTLLSETPRTCEYYYLVSDGNTDRAVGVFATPEQIQFIEPGSTYAMLAKRESGDKALLPSPILHQTDCQTAIYERTDCPVAVLNRQPEDCILMSSCFNPEKYPVLFQRMMERYGTLDEISLQEVIKQPVANPSNLHNAIFLPSELKVWISHSGANGEPACDQPYFYFCWHDLNH